VPARFELRPERRQGCQALLDVRHGPRVLG
jgi:hypothetical protein